jgi:hypothetical protein
MWNFKENDAVETDAIDVKGFKPTGKFYEDVDSLCKTFNVKKHPALRNPQQHSGEGSDEVKEVT